jgi:16S rRNA (guanine(1405)-N(7))-methyltransferase
VERTEKKGHPTDKLVEAVQKSAKYKHICAPLIRRIGAHELGVRRNLKAAVKATKGKLHQVAGAYFETAIDYDRAWCDLRQSAAQSREALQRTCRALMALHVSTKERLHILETFYTTTLADVGPIHTVLDLACGLNPLAIPQMPLDSPVTYYAYDIYTDMMAFLQKALPLLGVAGQAEAQDIIQTPPLHQVDLALLLKAIPCLAHVDIGAPADSPIGRRMLEAVNARYILVSFPVHSIGGVDKGMAETYSTRFLASVAGKPWEIQRFEFSTELAFLVRKPRGAI